ncbi:solute carrier family 25 member 44 [Elysia marginata]|uniref:Solute carrier family 25 member 44 n=1 Tax=Elysia marginata TaxID=1093978 RepID=A0AAV4G1V9_9GAST|nr:solute carrier family 25 member 44 [Elysia marginata]
MSFEMEEIQVIELKMMDKRKYYPLTLASGLTIRSMLYPFMLIKTRLQIQRSKTVYNGTFDALIKIGRNEGTSGLYRGFWVSCLQLFPSMAYISSYEGMRHYMAEHMGVTENSTRAFVENKKSTPAKTASPEASREKAKAKEKLTKLQHFHISEEEARTRMGSLKAIIRAIYTQDGALGFYKGYFVSLACFAPNSALWWFFYDAYTSHNQGIKNNLFTAFFLLAYQLPGEAQAVNKGPPHHLIMCDLFEFFHVFSAVAISASVSLLSVILGLPLALRPCGFYTKLCLVMNCLVLLKVEGLHLRETVEILWREEGVWMATKGLSARLVQSITFSFFLMLGYETIKRWSVLDEYKDRIRW